MTSSLELIVEFSNSDCTAWTLGLPMPKPIPKHCLFHLRWWHHHPLEFSGQKYWNHPSPTPQSHFMFSSLRQSVDIKYKIFSIIRALPHPPPLSLPSRFKQPSSFVCLEQSFLMISAITLTTLPSCFLFVRLPIWVIRGIPLKNRWYYFSSHIASLVSS